MDHTTKAYHGIKKMLLHNEIGAGQKIVYGDLARRLGMSPTPVVQALKLLEHRGLLRHEPNKGYYAGQISLKEIREIYELREIMEVSLLPETLKLVDEKGIERLRVARDAHVAADQTVYLNDRLQKDMEFHLVLASLSQLEIHQNFLKQLFDLLYLKYRASILFTSAIKTVENEHQKIFECLRARDLGTLQAALSQHISNIKKHVLIGMAKMLKEQES